MCIKKLLQRVMLDSRMKARGKDREKKQKKKNSRLAKLLTVTKDIK